MPRRRLAVALVAGGALAVAAPASADFDAGTLTRTAGPVTATLSWQAGPYGITSPSLVVVRDGVTYAPALTDVCGDGCILVGDGPDTTAGTSTLKVADLDGDGEPEVLVDAYSGGAHCCTTTRVLTFDGTGYWATDIEWRDVSYTLTDADGDGRPELVGQDPRFAAAFTAYAGSAFPVSVLQVTKGATADVTRRFPALVRAQATRLRRDLRRAGPGDDVRGVLAAYVADQYLLGRGATGLAEIRRQTTARRVSRGFRGLLLRTLHRWGYR